MARTVRLSRAEMNTLARAPMRRIHGSLFSAGVTPLPATAGGHRVACVVSKKVSAKAVERNRIKRVAREEMRMHPIKHAPCAVILYAKTAARQATAKDMREDIAGILRKL